METCNLGRSGLRVSALGLGCNNLAGRFDHAGSLRVVHAALEFGITFLDTADVYPLGKSALSEQYLAEALGVRRKDMIVATKFGSPATVRPACFPVAACRAAAPPLHHGGCGDEPAQSPHRLHRRLSDAPDRSADADRGDGAGAQ